MPIFLVVEDTPERKPAVMSTVESWLAIPVFSEELHAERWRDATVPEHLLLRLDDFADLVEELTKYKETIKYVTLDPRDVPRATARLIAIENIISRF